MKGTRPRIAATPASGIPPAAITPLEPERMVCEAMNRAGPTVRRRASLAGMETKAEPEVCARVVGVEQERWDRAAERDRAAAGQALVWEPPAEAAILGKGRAPEEPAEQVQADPVGPARVGPEQVALALAPAREAGQAQAVEARGLARAARAEFRTHPCSEGPDFQGREVLEVRSALLSAPFFVAAGVTHELAIGCWSLIILGR